MRNFDRDNFDPAAFIGEAMEKARRDCKGHKVFLLVSGGVDSTVVFALLNKALGPDRVLGVHVDNGLMRLNESAAILEYMRANGFDNLHIEDAQVDFLTALEGVYDPEEKRKIIGDKYLEIKDKASRRLGLNSGEWILAQGTIYPDILETDGKAGGPAAGKIKTHHNRVDAVIELIGKGLIIEPIAPLYKDEVRAVGAELGLSRDLLWRHPFPGPGLGVRILCSDGRPPAGDITAGELSKLDGIAAAAGYGCRVLPLRSTGKRDGGRTYARPVLITGEFNREKVEKLTAEIITTIPSVNRVVYGCGIAEPPVYNSAKAHITRARLDKLRAIDAVVTEALKSTGEYDAVWQMPVVLLPLTGGDSGGEPAVLRPVRSIDAMEADAVWLKEETLSAIIGKKMDIDGAGDIFLDVTPKPPATIEWE